MDGTLIDSESTAGAIVSEHLRWRGIHLPAPICQRLFSGHHESRIRDVVRRLGHRLPPTFERTLRDDLLERMHVDAKATTGALELTESLDPCLKVAVVSNSHPDRVRSALRTAGFDSLLARAFIVGFREDNELRPKPAPDLYLAALSQCGARPEDAIAIEDTTAGVSAAVAAGIRVVLVDPLGMNPSSGAQTQVPTLTALMSGELNPPEHITLAALVDIPTEAIEVRS